MTNFQATTHDRGLDAIRRIMGDDSDDQALRGLKILRLVRAVNGAYDALLIDGLGDVQLSPHRWRVLLRIWLEEQSGCAGVHPTQLSKAQQLSKNTISEHLRALEEAGLVSREVDVDDRRQFKIHLTEAGRALVQRSTPGHIRFLNTLLDGLSASDVHAVEESLEMLHASLLSKARGACCAAQG
jgi:DNA-binding MarR family transcriptional regulator